MSTQPPFLKPALILGSGFHRHVFGERPPQDHRNCLYDWQALVSATADRIQVACPSKEQSPVLRWETLINRAVREGYRNRKGAWQAPNNNAAYHVERDAKAVVANLITVSSEQYPESTRARIPLDERWGCVISLNFDHAWRSDINRKHLQASSRPLAGAGFCKINSREWRRLNTSVPPLDSGASSRLPRLWFPNGSTLQPESIRMGLHDYGSAPAAIRHAFNSLKAWEHRPGAPSTASQTGFARTAVALRVASERQNSLDEALSEPPMPLTWVAEFLYRPLVFAGVGLSEQEFGLWWLLAQRARNVVRVQAPQNASARILVHRNDRPAFWATRPFGLRAIPCSDWDEGWEQVMMVLNEEQP